MALGIFAAGLCAAATLSATGHGGMLFGVQAPSSSKAIIGRMRELHEKVSEAASHMRWHELPEGLSADCKAAFRKHELKKQEKAMKLLGDAMKACEAGESSDECKAAEKRGRHLELEVEKDCKAAGYLCKITSTDKEGPEEEDECVPKECHGELEKLEAAIKKDMEHEEDEDVPECKEFDCKADITC